MITADNMYKALLRSVDSLSKNEELINKANVFPVPDGDTGTNMLLTLRNAVEKTPRASSFSSFSKDFSYNILRSARGNSGVILSVAASAFFEAAHKNDSVFTLDEIAHGLANAKTAAYETVSKPEEGTILTLLSAISDYAKKYCTLAKNDGEFLGGLLSDAKNTLNTYCCESTAQRKTSLPDSGALGLYFILEGMIAESENVFLTEQKSGQTKKIGDDFEEKPYCTQFIIDKNENADAALIEDFTFFVKETGESALVVNSPSFIKVHTHTDCPGETLTRALKIGTLSEIEIDNMLLQSKKASSSAHSIAAIYSGQGVKELFESLGVSSFISSGESYNPETAEILSVLDKAPEKNIILLTNHKNSLLAAKQASRLSDKKVSIVPAHCTGEQLAALSVFNETDSLQNNVLALTKAVSSAKTLDISIASKDAVIDKNRIKQGQYIAFSGKTLIVNEASLSLAAIKAAKYILGKSRRSLTILYNDTISYEEALSLKKKIESAIVGKLQITLLYGGQKIYCLSLLAD